MAEYRPWPAWVVRSNEEIENRYGLKAGTYRGHADRDPGHDMSGDLAADFWTTSKTKHDAVLAWFKVNAKRIGAIYIITWNRIWSVERASEGVRDYGSTGDASDRHTNHVHISYGVDPPVSTPAQPTLGVPLMADAVPIKVTYNDEQALTAEATGHVHINAEKHTSVVEGSSDGIDVTAVVEVEGLKEGEYVHVWWRKEWKKTGSADQNKGGDIQDSAFPGVAGAKAFAQVRYADKLPKADAGWTACLRLMYSTNSKTAKIVRRQIRGWKLA
jgi:hypothetical protein